MLNTATQYIQTWMVLNVFSLKSTGTKKIKWYFMFSCDFCFSILLNHYFSHNHADTTHIVALIFDVKIHHYYRVNFVPSCGSWRRWSSSCLGPTAPGQRLSPRRCGPCGGTGWRSWRRWCWSLPQTGFHPSYPSPEINQSREWEEFRAPCAIVSWSHLSWPPLWLLACLFKSRSVWTAGCFTVNTDLLMQFFILDMHLHYTVKLLYSH